MSKLADAIRRSQRVESTPIGFGASRPQPKASMLVGFFGVAADAAKGRDAGADFVLIDGRGNDIDVKSVREQAGELPLGVWTDVQDSAAARALSDGGVDFLVIDEDSPAASLLDDDLGYVMALPAQPDDTTLRSLSLISLEALLLGSVPSPLTVSGQMELGRAGALTRRPLICEVEGTASGDDLLCLRAAGVACVMTSAASVAAVKETVMGLPPRRSRREERAVVSLPRGQAVQHDDEDDDDDDSLF